MRFVAVSVVCVLVLGGLVFWVFASTPPPGDFEVTLDHTRPLPQGDVYVGNFPEPPHLNPFTSSDAVALGYVVRFTHDSLLSLDSQTGELVPALAEVVEQSEDQLSFVFRLRDGVKFADGQPVTVEDVRFTWEVVRDGAVPTGSIRGSVADISGFTEVDPRTFRIGLRERNFLGLAGMATGYLVLQKAWFMAQVEELARAAGEPVPTGPGEPSFGALLAQVRYPGPGTGPYKIAEDAAGRPAWIPNRDLWLVQNPLSWHRVAYPERWNLAGIRLRFITDSQAAFTEFRQQKLDWHLPMDPYALLEENPELDEHYQVLKYDYAKLGQFFVVWNHEASHPTRDPRVRRALAMLFDRVFIRDEVLGKSARVAHSWFKPGTREYATDLEPIPFDPAAARALLAEAGYGPDNQLVINIVAEDRPRYERMLGPTIEAAEQIGVDLRVRLMEWSAALGERSSGAFDGFMMLWNHSVVGIDPYEFFHSNPGGTAGGHNRMRSQDADIDRLLVEARRELDEDRRVELYQQFNRWVHETQPITLLVHPINTLLIHKRFQELEPISPFNGVTPERWYVREGEQLHRIGR